jgi:hypothetical protein
MSESKTLRIRRYILCNTASIYSHTSRTELLAWKDSDGAREPEKSCFLKGVQRLSHVYCPLHFNFSRRFNHDFDSHPETPAPSGPTKFPRRSLVTRSLLLSP